MEMPHGLRSVRRLAGLLVLVAGLGFGAVVWQRAGTARESLRYEVIDGVPYAVRQEDTKAYARQMELFGGKGLVLARQFMDWLDDLGRSRGVAVALVVMGIAGAAWGLAPRRDHAGKDADHTGQER